MSTATLTKDQQALVDTEESLFAAACPGAGKTHAMVARFLRRTAEEKRRGVGLISFTNAAIDEVKRRCGSQADSLKSPHFVGTFDSFLHRFIVTPLYTRTYKMAPKYVQTWKEAPNTSFRMYDYADRVDLIPNSVSIELGWFDFDINSRANLARIPQNYGKTATDKLNSLRADAESRASDIFRRLLKAGTVSCEAARVLTGFWIKNPETHKILAALLKARFSEIIVDEAQDCGEQELAVLRFLRSCGIRIVMVGDIDQSIYEFREALPREVREFTETLPIQLILDQNFRSSPAVCAFNNSLRSGQLVETASGDAAEVTTPVQLIEFSGLDDIVPAVLPVAEKYSLTIDDLMLLAHSTTHGMKAAGVADVGGLGGNRVVAIADAGFKLRSTDFDARTRLEAIRQVEKIMVATLIDGSSGHKSLEAVCEEHSIDMRWLRDFTVRMAVSLNADGKAAKGFALEVREFLRVANWGGVTPPSTDGLGTTFMAPKATVWSKVASLRTDPLIRYSTVHGVKGMEFPGVVVVIPDKLRPDKVTGRTVLDDWAGGHDTEARRVLYVAASRAQELLILAVHRKHAGRVADLLYVAGVPYEQS